MIAICTNPFRDIGLEYTCRVIELLKEAGFESCVCPIFYDDSPELLPDNIDYCRLSEAVRDAELVLVIGGDGTILAAVRQLHNVNVPILGVNLGTKGFMTAIEPENIELVVKAARGEYEISSRMKLDVSLIREGKTIYTDCALNDIVLHGYGDCVKVSSWSDDSKINSFSGDGIILSTPTGSTGYSMSAGGPIVEPDAENIIVSPICAHVMGSRSFVLSPDRIITVKVEMQHGRRAYLSVDGNSVCDLANGDSVVVKKSDHHVLMAGFDIKSFFETAYDKLI